MVQIQTETPHEYPLNHCDTSDDLDMVLERSRLAGVKSMIITGGSLHESKEALQLAETYGLLLTRKPAPHGADRTYRRLLRNYRMPSYTIRPV
jgi:Tat protein secretion system quality control protein TatD with DNase activity